MSDLDIGMNQRLCRPFEWDPARDYDRGKVMTAAELESGRISGSLQRRRWGWYPLAHASRHPPDAWQFFHPRQCAMRMPATRSAGRIMSITFSAC